MLMLTLTLTLTLTFLVMSLFEEFGVCSLPLLSVVLSVALDAGGVAIDRGQVPRGKVREDQEPAGGGELAGGEPSNPLHVRQV